MWIPARETEAVVEEEVAPRSYEVTTPSGVTVHRNRQDLVTIPHSSEGKTPPDGLPDGEMDVYDADADEESTSTPDREEQPLRRGTRVRTPYIPYDPSWK